MNSLISFNVAITFYDPHLFVICEVEYSKNLIYEGERDPKKVHSAKKKKKKKKYFLKKKVKSHHISCIIREYDMKGKRG
jgi:hypothetical protein